jgi:tetratricopeptide (TPR) repeat protein
MDDPAPPFLSPEELIDRSQPAPRTGWFWYGLGGFVLVILLSTFGGAKSPAMQSLVQFMGAITLLGLMFVMGGYTWYAVKRQREEQRRLEAIEELVQLRRWPEAALMLQQLLSQPTRTPTGRVQGLIYLASVLGRYHRYADAVAVQEHLLEKVNLDPGTTYGLKLARAMAMLHEDRLVDTDRAISELRRIDGSGDSAGLVLLELYRDVKTGHPAEAIDLFKEKLELLRKQLGQRLADAYALIAKAYDMVGQDALSQEAYTDATLLAPIAEVSRRYAEVATLAGKYTPATAPAE